jgi:universal stress protein E
MEINNILVVFDPTSDAQPALERAVVIAKNAPASTRLQLFSCIYTKLTKSEKESGEKKKLLAAQEEILSGVVAPLLEQGVQVVTSVEWKKNWYQAVVRASAQSKADAVIKASHKHSATQRLFKKTSDWTLIRECDIPVLLVKDEVGSGVRKALAAVDLRREGKDSYEKINENIFKFCERFVGTQDAEVHFVNAHKDLPSRPDRGSMIRACGVDGAYVHIKMGEPSKAIVETAKELNVNLVVIGNSTRSGLSAVVNNNTAEKIVDELECDLLAIP